MQYLPGRRLFFIHVPKCAGTSVRRSLLATGETSVAPFAADLGISEAEAREVVDHGHGIEHPRLGRLHPAHLPLSELEAEMPNTWRVLTNARSFALVRPPRDRFISALMQRMKEFGGAGAIRADDASVRDEAARVCDWLDAHPDSSRLEYIHFARQSGFTDHEGKRIADRVFPVDRTDALAKWIAAETGLEVVFPSLHVRRQPKSWARGVQPVARFVGRRLMTAGVRRVVHPLWQASGAFADARQSYAGVDMGAEVEAFVADYYAGDFALHEDAQAALAPARAVG